MTNPQWKIEHEERMKQMEAQAELDKASFLKEFQDLLNKYKAEFQVELDRHGHDYYSARCSVSLCGIYEIDPCTGRPERNYIEFQLDNYMSSKKKSS